jgi:hypothetical protein
VDIHVAWLLLRRKYVRKRRPARRQPRAAFPNGFFLISDRVAPTAGEAAADEGRIASRFDRAPRFDAEATAENRQGEKTEKRESFEPGVPDLRKGSASELFLLSGLSSPDQQRRRRFR